MTEPESTMTAQEASDALFEGGLSFQNGLRHQPSYVRCQETAVEEFRCYVQVEGVAPYEVRLYKSNDALAFDYLGYVSP
jgi:hypothetical protein